MTTAMRSLVTRQQAQAVLLAAIQADPCSRWKSGRAARVLRQAGLHPVSPGIAARYLQALVVGGHLTRHDEPGCTWYEPTAASR